MPVGHCLYLPFRPADGIVRNRREGEDCFGAYCGEGNRIGCECGSRSAFETMKRLLSYLLLLPIYFLPEVYFAHDFPFVQIYSYLFSICS